METILPDAIDWGNISLWAAGIATVITSMAVAIVQGVRSATKIAQTIPSPPPAMHKTDVYTTDSLAMDRLTTSMTTLTNALQAEMLASQELLHTSREANVLLKDSLQERRSLKEAIDINTAATERSAAQLEELRPADPLARLAQVSRCRRRSS
jgi:hypothetical protein